MTSVSIFLTLVPSVKTTIITSTTKLTKTFAGSEKCQKNHCFFLEELSSFLFCSCSSSSCPVVMLVCNFAVYIYLYLYSEVTFAIYSIDMTVTLSLLYFIDTKLPNFLSRYGCYRQLISFKTDIHVLLLSLISLWHK